jgi:OOP family OmpA-OmpF porin
MSRIKEFLLLTLLLLLPAHAFTQEVTNDAYARDLMGQVEKNPFGLCWRTYSWTPEKAIAECDPDLVKKPAPAASPRTQVPAPIAAPAPVLAPAAPAAPAAAVAAPVAAALVVPPPAPAPERRTISLTLGADASFDTGKADLKAEGRSKLDDVALKLAQPGVQIESMTITGHTDSVGSTASNQKLSERRADAVKAYLVGKGVDGSKVKTVGRGARQPISDNKTPQGRGQNRRVELEVTGARTTQ